MNRRRRFKAKRKRWLRRFLRYADRRGAMSKCSALLCTDKNALQGVMANTSGKGWHRA